jgi:hypothetical protein
MADFQFTSSRIDQETISIGLDVRPPIELALDALRIQQFYNDISERFPNLFADLNQGKTKFQISKDIPIPGKGQISVFTFTLTQRGPVFNFPITLPGVIEDHRWSETLSEDVIKCLHTFHRHLPGTQFFRIGKVRNLVFQCADADAREMFRKRFCPQAPDGSENLEVGWNDPDDRYNRKLTVKTIQKTQMVQRDVGGSLEPVMVPQGEHGINVIFDVNNRGLDKPLDDDQMQIILDHADELYNNYFYDLLSQGRP